jgi:hypothetical protein
MPKKPVDIDKMLQESEAGRGPRNLKEQTQMQHGMTRGMKKDGTMPPAPKQGQIPYMDHAPSGGVSPRGDLGSMSEHERKMFFPHPIKDAGKTLAGTQHLPYRKPAIEGGEGPHAV